jgi:hypothetical protein
MKKIPIAFLAMAGWACAQGPSLPFPLTVTDFSHDYVKVAWDDFGIQPTTDKWSLQVKVKGDWDTTNTRVFSATTNTFGSLQEETTYEFRAVFRGVPSYTLTVTTPAAFSGSVTAMPAGTGELADDLLVGWDLEPGAVGYVVRYDLIASGPFGPPTGFVTRVINSGTIGQTTFEDLNSGSTYFVEVHALLPGDARTGWASPDANAVLGFPPPQNFNATRVEGAPVRLFYDQELGADTYTIERSEDNPDNFMFLASVLSNSIEYTDASADAQTHYYYRIRSNASNPTETSDWTYDDVWSSKPQPPGGVMALAQSDSEVLITWNEVPGVTEGYEVQRSESPFTVYETIGFSQTDGFLDGLDEDDPIAPGVTYRYRVISLSGDGLLGRVKNASTRQEDDKKHHEGAKLPVGPHATPDSLKEPQAGEEHLDHLNPSTTVVTTLAGNTPRKARLRNSSQLAFSSATGGRKWINTPRVRKESGDIVSTLATLVSVLGSSISPSVARG